MEGIELSRKVAFRKRKQNRLGMFLVFTVVVMLLVVVSVKSNELKNKKDIYLVKQTQLENQIEEEQKRTEDILEFGKYTKTKKFVEEVAKDKLGLVNEDEIIFKCK